MNAVLSVLVVVLAMVAFNTQTAMASSRRPRKAICELVPDPNVDMPIRGRVEFKQVEWQVPYYDHIRVTVRVRGLKQLPPGLPLSDRQHGFHVHANGDISGGCGSAGGHYNPTLVSHGSRLSYGKPRHTGDFGNLVQTRAGRIKSYTFYDNVASLYGDDSIIGRAIVLHANADDLGKGGNAGSVASGNAGPRLACCVIKEVVRDD